MPPKCTDKYGHFKINSVRNVAVFLPLYTDLQTLADKHGPNLHFPNRTL